MNNEEKNCIICVKYANSFLTSDWSLKYVRRVFEETETEEGGVLVITRRPTIMLVPERKDATKMTQRKADEVMDEIALHWECARDWWVEKD